VQNAYFYHVISLKSTLNAPIESRLILQSL